MHKRLGLFPLIAAAALGISGRAFAEPPRPSDTSAPAPTAIVVSDPPAAAPPRLAPLAPVAEVQMERRSSAAMVSGIVLSSAGVLAFNLGVLGGGVGDCFDACGSRQDTSRVFMIGGIVAALAGIPLIVIGAKRVPVTNENASLPAWAGNPGGTGWRWRF